MIPQTCSRFCILVILGIVVNFTACQTFEDPKYNEFTRTTDFTDFGTFYVEEVSVSDHRRFYEETAIVESSEKAVFDSLVELGYASAAQRTDADFRVFARWQLVSALLSRETFGGDRWAAGSSAIDNIVDKRYNLVIEIADIDGVFWRYESDDRLDPAVFSAERARAIVGYAIERFPASTLFLK